MKKFFISDTGFLGIDTETEEMFSLDTQREALSRIFMAEEPMTIVVKKDNKDYELNAKKDDLIVAFYEKEYEYPVIIVESEDWVKNLKGYRKIMQKRKEEWAQKNACSDECKCDANMAA